MDDNVATTPVEATEAPTEQPAPPTNLFNPEEPAGVPDGHVIVTPPGQLNEKIVNDYDAEGNTVGWHKVLVEGTE